MDIFFRIDWWFFFLINQKMKSDYLDAVLPFIRNANIWIPLYIFLLMLILVNRPRRALSWILTFIGVASVTDLISSSLVKPLFGRIRPCNNPLLQEKVRSLLPYKPQNFSFTSSHAANHMALAVFLFITLTPLVHHKWRMLFFGWALIIGYAQVYVGVHYPSVILGGFLVGGLIGFAFAKAYHAKFGIL
jgi:membrane-associated phospholipid phosphatase